jgi:hypothetical protein
MNETCTLPLSLGKLSHFPDTTALRPEDTIIVKYGLTYQKAGDVSVEVKLRYRQADQTGGSEVGILGESAAGLTWQPSTAS